MGHKKSNYNISQSNKILILRKLKGIVTLKSACNIDNQSNSSCEFALKDI